ncbi:beta-phosphoglucomutase [Aquirufa regiilacus]|uniref:Beta-phosphoglucomutase n=1 Tax=Aquirufa regiilacus TaxID=3024868 RepID=A0ABU3TQJ0_9BACT|nr:MULTISPECIES: beta-phosphoglucomutase [unclassified Aquirufa]MDT8886903.1 beta-phosphoglucomutase [Aquirufa sp. LEPPI-3A]MDU0808132.1 beta-phosphoglucomutase [Aquirufa sp. LEOWEIH-7C]
MMYKACLFDLDGVLVDTAIYHFQAWKNLGKQFGYELTEEQNEQLKGVSRVESLNKILDWANYTATQEEKSVWLIEKNEDYLRLISNMNPSEILPGVLSFLEQIKALGYKIALGSASKNAEIILDKTGLTPWFDLIIDGNKVSKSKPDPEVFLKGAEGLGIAPEECIVFEDAQAGVEAAKAGNMKAIGIGESETLFLADKIIPNFIGVKAAELLQF